LSGACGSASSAAAAPGCPTSSAGTMRRAMTTTSSSRMASECSWIRGAPPTWPAARSTTWTTTCWAPGLPSRTRTSSRLAAAGTRTSSSRRPSPLAMKVQVRLFARYREAAGSDRVELDLPDGGTAEAAWDAVSHRFPVLGPYRPFTLFAVRDDYVGPEHPLREGDELSLFPPVSGGGPESDSIQVTSEPLSE